MIQIYAPGNTNYSANGDTVLTPTSARLTCELNGAWGLEIIHPIDDEGRCKHILPSAIIKAPSFLGRDQLFKIYSVDKRDSGIVAGAEPVFMGCREDVFLTDVRPIKKAGKQALDIILAGTKYRGESNITKVSTAYYEYVNALEAIGGDNENSFISRWGGEILFDNYTIKINDRVGDDYGVELRYGKNIPSDGLSENVDFSGLCTRIYPKAYNGIKYDKGGKAYVDSANIGRYANVFAKTITFDYIKLKEDAKDNEADNVIVCDTLAQVMTELEKAVKAEFAKGTDLPKVTIKADMVMLKDTTLYEDYKALEDVSIGDTVHCIHNRLDIKTDARVIGLTYDCILKRVISVVLGDYQSNYFTNISTAVSGISDRVNGAIAADGSIMAERIKGFINGAAAGLKAQYNVAKKQDVQAILFENLDEQSSMFGALGIGTQGLQISKRRTSDGRGWDWTTAITAGGMIADTIVTGALSSKDGSSCWDLDTGKLEMTGDFHMTGGSVQIESDDSYNYLELNSEHLKATMTPGMFEIYNKLHKATERLEGHLLQFSHPNGNFIELGMEPDTGLEPYLAISNEVDNIYMHIHKDAIYMQFKDNGYIGINHDGIQMSFANGIYTSMADDEIQMIGNNGWTAIGAGYVRCMDKNDNIIFDTNNFVN